MQQCITETTQFLPPYESSCLEKVSRLDFLKSNLRSYGLFDAEIEVVVLLIKGLDNIEIAQKRFTCEKTVKFHLTNIFKKMGINKDMRTSRWRLMSHCVKVMFPDLFE